MKEQLIAFKTAKLAKEKGFVFSTNKIKIGSNIYKKINITPTQSLLQKWLREVHNIHIFIDKTRVGGNYQFIIHEKLKSNNVYEFSWNVLKYSNSDFNTYEEALEVGLQEALNLISHKR